MSAWFPSMRCSMVEPALGCETKNSRSVRGRLSTWILWPRRDDTKHDPLEQPYDREDKGRCENPCDGQDGHVRSAVPTDVGKHLDEVASRERGQVARLDTTEDGAPQSVSQECVETAQGVNRVGLGSGFDCRSCALADADERRHVHGDRRPAQPFGVQPIPAQHSLYETSASYRGKSNTPVEILVQVQALIVRTDGIDQLSPEELRPEQGCLGNERLMTASRMSPVGTADPSAQPRSTRDSPSMNS